MRVSEYRPPYLDLYESGELARRADALEAMLASCDICPRDCKVNRLNDDPAPCFSGRLPIVSSAPQHWGEEPVFVGNRGSGTIFFGNCNLRCVYCQNFQISQDWKNQKRDNEISHERLAEMMILQQRRGCANINFVSPTHFVPQIVRALVIACERGLHLPL
ncbi:MAG: radical SAM protein, partial [bacterium]